MISFEMLEMKIQSSRNKLTSPAYEVDSALSENLSMESMVSLDELRVRSLSSSRCFCFFLTFQWRHSAREANQSEIWSWAQMDGTG